MKIAALLLTCLAADALAAPRRVRRPVPAVVESPSCTKLEERRARDPSLQALLDISECRERTGDRAAAYVLYDEALEWAESRHDDASVARVRAKLDSLGEKLSLLVVHSLTPEQGAIIEAGPLLMPLGDQRRVPVAPGLLTVTVEAPGFVPWSKQVEVRELQHLQLQVPPLMPAEPLMAPPLPPPVFVATRREAPASRLLPAIALTASAMVFIAGITGLGWSYTTGSQLNAPSPTVTRAQFEVMRTVFPLSWATAAVGAAGLVASGAWLWRNGATPGVTVMPALGGASIRGSW